MRSTTIPQPRFLSYLHSLDSLLFLPSLLLISVCDLFFGGLGAEKEVAQQHITKPLLCGLEWFAGCFIWLYFQIILFYFISFCCFVFFLFLSSTKGMIQFLY
eukprot:TRINITY_DN6400_c0_g1_i1.p1 TRINITY_DN6400_c0_g1~~TRINITY_DN6400_c0_g1_i1.p1  ORF type:complete len:102 (+),score=20.26 TRINITY_DN6400_c0_g1_i1:97-402(+)